MYEIFPIAPADPDGPMILIADDGLAYFALADCPHCVIGALNHMQVKRVRLYIAGRRQVFFVSAHGDRQQRRRGHALMRQLKHADRHPRWPTTLAFDADPPDGLEMPLWRPDGGWRGGVGETPASVH